MTFDEIFLISQAAGISGYFDRKIEWLEAAIPLAKSEDDLKKVSDGRIFTGSKANQLKLIDQIGDGADAVKWLKSKENLKNLEVKNYNLVKPASKLEKLMEYTGNVKLIFSTIFNTILS